MSLESFEGKIVERTLTYVLAMLHIDWNSKLEKNDLKEKKQFLRNVFMMMVFKFILVLFAFNQFWFFVGYFVFFTIQNLIFHYSPKISHKKYAIHLTFGLIFLVLSQRIGSEGFRNFKIFEFNIMVFIGNFFLALVRFVEVLIKNGRYELFSKKTLTLISNYFIQESAILVSILLAFIFTFDFILLLQLVYMLAVWILMRFIYENLRMNDFKLFGNKEKIKEKFQSFEKILSYYEIKAKQLQNLETMTTDNAKKLVGVLLSYKMQEKDVLFHQFNKVGEFDKWVCGKLISPKILRTDERILISSNLNVL